MIKMEQDIHDDNNSKSKNNKLFSVFL